MRRFKFSLAPVLSAKRRSEDAIRAQAARLSREIRVEEARLREMRDCVSSARRDLAGIQASTVNTDMILKHLAYISRLGGELMNRRRRLEELSQERAAMLARLLQVAKERKALERLEGREKAGHQAEEARKEIKELDDMGAVSAARRRAAGEVEG